MPSGTWTLPCGAASIHPATWRLTAADRKALLRAYPSSAKRSRRALIVLLLADGLSIRDVRRVTYASFDLIADCAGEFRRGGVEVRVPVDYAVGGLADGGAA